MMSSLGLNHEVSILSSFESGAEGYHEGRIFCRSSQVFLGQDGIDDHLRFDRVPAHGFRVYEDRDEPLIPNPLHFIRPLDPNGPDAFDHRLTVVHGFAKGNRPSHGLRFRNFSDDHSEAALMKPPGHSGSKIPASSDENFDG